MPRARRSPGQASVEYVALVGVVGVLLLAAVALTSGGLGPTLAWALRTGLCRVTGAGCPPAPRDVADLPPCPLGGEARSEGVDFSVSLLKLGRRLGVRVERFSDGHVEVSFADDAKAGVVGEVGLKVDLGPLKGKAGAGLERAFTVGAGRTWRLRSPAAAAAFLRRYGRGQTLLGDALRRARALCVLCGALGISGPRDPPPPDERYTQRGARWAGFAALRAVWGGEVDAVLDDRALGRRVARDGSSRLYLSFGSSLTAEFFARVGVGRHAAAAGVIEIAEDPRGRPTSITLRALHRTAVTHGDPLAAPPPYGPERARGLPRELTREGEVRELETTLALRTPADVRAGRDLVAALGHARGAEPAAARLLDRLGRAGTSSVRVYRLEEGHGDLGVDVKAGPAGGALSVARDRQGLRLVRALTRLPGLPFLPRADCGRT